MNHRIAAFLVLLGLFVGGCARQDPPLLFHAAAGQRSALDEIGAIFEERHPGTRVNFSYKGSGRPASGASSGNTTRSPTFRRTS